MNPFKPAMEPGLYPDMSAEEYHSIPALSKSTLDHLHKSPAHMLAYLKEPHKDTPDTILGSLFHCLTMEPELFERRYAVVDGNRQTKAVKEEILAAEAEGKTVIRPDGLDAARAMAESVRSHPRAGVFIAAAKGFELSLFWELTINGVVIPCKARLDIMADIPGFGVALGDLKKTRDASLRGMSRHALEYRYHVQASWYRSGLYLGAGLTSQQFMLVCCEAEPPYQVGLYNISEAAQDLAQREIRADLELLAECIKTDNWPGYPVEVQELDLPAWAYKVEVA